MGWNFTGALMAIWAMSVMYIGVAMMTTEMASIIEEPGGQYAMAKSILGPLAAFNVWLISVFEYTMLEAADAVVGGDIVSSPNPELSPMPFIILTLLLLTLINYRGIYGTLTLNFFITAAAFASVMFLLGSTDFFDPSRSLIKLGELTDGLPYGLLGVFAAMQFGIWFFLGIEGTAMASSECRKVERALPVGTMIGLLTLLFGAMATWFVCSGLVEAHKLGGSVYPLYDAAVATGKPLVIAVLFAGTVLACLASANGCISDASHAWSALAKDTIMPAYFAAEHPRFGSYYRSIVFLLPISLMFAFTGMLDQIITFSIFSALLVYIITAVMMIRFRKMYPLGTIKRAYISPLHPVPALVTIALASCALFGMFLTYGVNMLSGTLFYALASLWFIKRRRSRLDPGIFVTPSLKKWGKPRA
ncbi:amino acid permease [Cloacibacillus sp. An23]|nr:amino acid permease [Cloacibacillus sp. An23]